MNIHEFPIVIDTGQFKTRVGTAANIYPQIITDTLLYDSVNEKQIKVNKGIFENLNLDKYNITSNFYSSQKHGSYEHLFTVNNYVGSIHPFMYTDRIDWNLLETFWTDIITKELYCDTSLLPVLLSEPHNAPFDFQDHSMEFFFESLSIPSFKTMPQEFLSFSAIQKNMPNIFLDDSGKGSVGTIVHFGDSSTRILPIASGFLLTEFIGTLNIGGFSVTKSLRDKFGPYLESNSIISHNDMNALKSFGLFDDFISDLIIPSLSEEIISVVKKCPVDYTRLLLGNILFIGGASINTSLVSKFENYFKVCNVIICF
ncbi:hypothetical protein FG386_002920 [Cryptosporidium ryanae]|uniref:uncharacterized protein n=1 Tax=Cryptosporidium ryanae TaxID=515981 RepID=UPI00351AA344|nr:hypothetical protein FG386_002920 [Cryptosporidium ryanae]